MKSSAGLLRFVVALAATCVVGSAGAQDPSKAPAQGAKPAAQTKPAAPAASPKPAQPATAAAGAKPDASYSVGVSMGEQLRRLGISPDMIATDKLTQGLKDGMSGKAQMSDEHQENLQTLVTNARAVAGERNKSAAQKFLAENGKRKGVVTTASGLQYRVINAGKGASPAPSDEVTVHYRGTLLDGTEFDSSIARGEPATFPANGVIKGWQEALGLMKTGAKWELFIPPELAYDLSSPPSIPPGSLLRFEVELLGFKPLKQ